MRRAERDRVRSTGSGPDRGVSVPWSIWCWITEERTEMRTGYEYKFKSLVELCWIDGNAQQQQGTLWWFVSFVILHLIW